MKQIDANAYHQIKTWIYRNARPLELALWQYHFEQGSQDAVLKTLSFYQNPDGGFGNALEPDNWNPHSSPCATVYAMGILERIDFHEKNHPIMQGIIRFLKSKAHFSNNMWTFTIPSNNLYPHAPWWTYSEERNQIESFDVTAGSVCFIIKYADPSSQLYQSAIAIINQLLEKLHTQSSFGDMGIIGYCVLLDTIKQQGITSRFDYSSALEKLKSSVYHSIERDISKWEQYGMRPSNYIHSPQSIFYQGNKDIVEQELDYLIETRPQNGVWNITWTWFENNKRYPNEFAIAENWWKSEKAIEKLLFLRNFNRLAVG